MKKFEQFIDTDFSKDKYNFDPSTYKDVGYSKQRHDTKHLHDVNILPLEAKIVFKKYGIERVNLGYFVESNNPGIFYGLKSELDSIRFGLEDSAFIIYCADDLRGSNIFELVEYNPKAKNIIETVNYQTWGLNDGPFEELFDNKFKIYFV